MKTTINSQSVRNEVNAIEFNKSFEQGNSQVKSKDKAKYVFIAFVISAIITIGILSHLGLVPKY